MKRLFLSLLVLLLLLAAPAAAQFSNNCGGPASGFCNGSGTMAFVGPLDGLATPKAACALRRLLTSYAANKAANIRRSSDNATQDVGFTAAGDFDATGFTSFVGGSSGFVTKCYDQSGNANDFVQATAANQLQITLNAANGHATMTASGSQFMATGSITAAQPFTFATVTQRTANTAATTMILSSGTFNIQLAFSNSANTILFTTGAGTSATANDNVRHAIGGIADGASGNSGLYIDQTQTVVSTGANTISGDTLNIFGASASFNPTGDISEAIFWAANDLGTVTLKNVQANEKTYYGTP